MNEQDEKYYVSLGMRKLGGGFCQALGMALTHADPNNTKKIKEAFPKYWEQYLEMGKRYHDDQEEKWRKRST